MTRKKTSSVLQESEEQLDGLIAIDSNLDLGEGCSVENMQAAIDELKQKVEDHKKALSVVESTKRDIRKLEKQLKQMQQQVRLGVAFRYTKESDQYRLIGGTPPSEAARKALITRLKAKQEQEGKDNTQN